MRHSPLSVLRAFVMRREARLKPEGTSYAVISPSQHSVSGPPASQVPSRSVHNIAAFARERTVHVEFEQLDMI